MFYLLFLASSLFANTDYYAITAGDILETYDVCYVALDYGKEAPALRRLKCSDSFNIAQNYYYNENKLSISWEFSSSRKQTIEKKMGYGEYTTVENTYNLTDDDVCYIEIKNSSSLIVDDGLFGCGMTKLFED